MNINEQINAKLDELEKVHGVKALYAVESGSRLWGMESANSDWDVRYIYVRPEAWYMSVSQKRKDTLLWISKDRLLDMSGWDIRKTLKLLSKSNPPLLEWLQSPLVYRWKSEVRDKLWAMGQRYYNARASMYHYLHMAENNYRHYLQADTVPLKKYLYVARPLLACEYIKDTCKIPPVPFADLIQASKDCPAEVLDLIERKKAGEELVTGRKIKNLNKWIDSRLEFYKHSVKLPNAERADLDELDEVFLNIVREYS